MADKPVTREEKYLAYLTGDYKGELPKPITRKEKYLYELCLKGIGGEISPEEIKNAVNEYLEKNPVKPGATTEQAHQIEQNKTDIGSLKEDLTHINETVGNILYDEKSISTDKKYTSKEKKTIRVSKSMLAYDFELCVTVNSANMLYLNDKYTILGTEKWYANGSVNSHGYYRYTWYQFISGVNAYVPIGIKKCTVASSEVAEECISVSGNGQIHIWSTIATEDAFKENLVSKGLLFFFENPTDTGKKYCDLYLENSMESKNICVEVNPSEYPYTFTIKKNGTVENAIDTLIDGRWYIDNDFSLVGGMRSNVWNVDLTLYYQSLIDNKDIFNNYVVVSKDGFGKYSTIQSAIDACSDGDTIFVKSGEYEEEVYFSGKQIHLIGEDKYSTILFNTTGDYDHAPLLTNSGIIENMTIYAKKDLTKEYPSGVNTCYAVHLDKGWNVDKPYVSFKNCIVKSDFNDAFGSGNIQGSVIEISDCFVSATFSSAFKLHPNSGGTEEAKVILRNNVLKSGNGVYDIFCHTDGATYNTVVHAFNNVLKSAIKSNSFTWGDMNYGNALPSLNTLVIS